MRKIGKRPMESVRREDLFVQKECPSFTQHGIDLPLKSTLLHQWKNTGQKGPQKFGKVLWESSMDNPRGLPDMWHRACGVGIRILGGSGWDYLGSRMPPVSSAPESYRLEAVQWSNTDQ